jgi:thiamine-monophosphate kinase
VERAIAAAPDLLSQVLGGGDDYEVLLTAPANVLPPLRRAAAAAGIDLTAIGAIDRRESEGEACFIDDGGGRIAIEKAGWTHS